MEHYEYALTYLEYASLSNEVGVAFSKFQLPKLVPFTIPLNPGSSKLPCVCRFESVHELINLCRTSEFLAPT